MRVMFEFKGIVRSKIEDGHVTSFQTSDFPFFLPNTKEEFERMQFPLSSVNGHQRESELFGW